MLNGGNWAIFYLKMFLACSYKHHTVYHQSTKNFKQIFWNFFIWFIYFSALFKWSPLNNALAQRMSRKRNQIKFLKCLMFEFSNNSKFSIIFCFFQLQVPCKKFKISSLWSMESTFSSKMIQNGRNKYFHIIVCIGRKESEASVKRIFELVACDVILFKLDRYVKYF